MSLFITFGPDQIPLMNNSLVSIASLPDPLQSPIRLLPFPSRLTSLPLPQIFVRVVPVFWYVRLHSPGLLIRLRGEKKSEKRK